MIQQFNSLFDLTRAFPNEMSCIKHFQAIRWKNDAFCPYCRSTTVYHFTDEKTHKCGDCRKRFSIKVGTIFEDSKVPLQKWFMAIWLITSRRKSIASTQLAKDISVTQKTAWFMLHRLRHAAKTKSFNRPLESTIEADETFVGGNEKNKHDRDKLRVDRGGVGKMPVLGAKKRDGEVRFEKAAELTGRVARDMVHRHIEGGSVLITGEARAYRGQDGEYNHYTVNRTAGEYAHHYLFHTNVIESAWALLKRQFIGIHHFTPAKHLQRYLDEIMFRQNCRDLGEGSRVKMLLADSNGKRLSYKELIA